MKSKATSRAEAQSSTAAALAIRSRFTLRKVSYAEYLNWFEQVGKVHLFSEELQEGQREMWFVED